MQVAFRKMLPKPQTLNPKLTSTEWPIMRVGFRKTWFGSAMARSCMYMHMCTCVYQQKDLVRVRHGSQLYVYEYEYMLI